MTQVLVTLGILGVLAGAGCWFWFGTEAGKDLRDKWFGPKDKLTDLQEADSLSSAQDMGAVAPGVARDPYSVVLGYYIDSKIASKVRRDPEHNGQLVSTEPHLPTLIFGPPGSGKTTALLQPAILTFGLGKSPILAGSVKHDLAQATIKLRAKLGKAQIFDPTGQTPANLRKYAGKWTPLAAATTWRGANETADSMVFASDDANAGDSFWASQSVSLLSVMLFIIASRPGTSMQDVSELLGNLLAMQNDGNTEDGSPATGDESDSKGSAKGFEWLSQEIEQKVVEHERKLGYVREASDNGDLGVGEATSQIVDLETKLDEFKAAKESLLPFISIAATAPPTIGGILASVSNVLQVYRYARDYARIPHDDPELIDIDEFLDGPNTVYLCAPPRKLGLYAPLLSAFATAVIGRAYEIGQESASGSLPHGLLLAIDELAAMPLADIPALFSTGRSYKINFVVATQDASQLIEKYGENLTNSLISSSAAVVVLPRTKDVNTLRLVSDIAGEVRVKETSKTFAKTSNKAKGEEKGKQEGKSESTTESYAFRPLLPRGKITTFAKNEAFAIVGNQRCQLLMRPYYQASILTRLAEGDATAIKEENAFKNVKTDVPAQPTENLVDFSDPVEDDPHEQKHRKKQQAQARQPPATSNPRKSGMA